jgi:hypothetical protein
MIRAIGPPSPEIMEWEPTPDERATALAEQEEFRKNTRWFSAHAKEIRDQHPGKYICVAGQELFVADDAGEVYAQARAAHPIPGGGFFTIRISEQRGLKIYANRRTVG